MAFSGSISILAMKDGDYQYTSFAGTTAGLQAAIDHLAGGKGKVWVGPGTLLTTTAIWIHSNCHLQGSGRGKTIIKRADGSITDSDAANSGAVIASSQYGANGTISNSAATVSNIEISDITLDGNESAHSSLTDQSIGQFGLYLRSCDGAYIHGVTIQNTLRSGYFLNECSNIHLSDVMALTVGQWSVVTTRNAFDFYNYSNATTGGGKYFTLNGFYVNDVGDEVASLTNVSHVAISNGVVDTCDMVFELQGSSNTTTDTNVSISNIVATNMLQGALVIASNQTHAWNGVVMDSCSFIGDASNQDARMIMLEGGTAHSLSGVRISNCVFKNINTKDTTSRSWIDANNNTGADFSDITIENCSFFGKSGSIRTDDTAFNLLVQNGRFIVLKNCFFKDVPGRGIRIHDPNASCDTRNIIIDSVVVDTCNGVGFQIACEQNSSTLTDIHLLNCVAKDTNVQTGDSGFQIITSATPTLFSKIYLRGCRAFKTSGSTMEYGLDLNETSGTLDDITVENCDFSGVSTAEMRLSAGTPTNMHVKVRTGRGTDIASAATVSIPHAGDVFHVTGTTNITNGVTVNPWDNGRIVTLVFDDVLTISDTGTSKLDGNFTTAADDTLTLRCDGTNWYEVGRSSTA